MDDLKQHSRRLGVGRSGAANQCIAYARKADAWKGQGNDGVKKLPRIDDAKGQELILLLAIMVQNGKVTEDEAHATLTKHGF